MFLVLLLSQVLFASPKKFVYKLECFDKEKLIFNITPCPEDMCPLIINYVKNGVKVDQRASSLLINMGKIIKSSSTELVIEPQDRTIEEDETARKETVVFKTVQLNKYGLKGIILEKTYTPKDSVTAYSEYYGYTCEYKKVLEILKLKQMGKDPLQIDVLDVDTDGSEELQIKGNSFTFFENQYLDKVLHVQYDRFSGRYQSESYMLEQKRKEDEQNRKLKLKNKKKKH